MQGSFAFCTVVDLRSLLSCSVLQAAFDVLYARLSPKDVTLLVEQVLSNMYRPIVHFLVEHELQSTV